MFCKYLQQCVDCGSGVWFAQWYSEKFPREHITGCEYVAVAVRFGQSAYQVDFYDVFRSVALSVILFYRQLGATAPTMLSPIAHLAVVEVRPNLRS